MVGPFKKRKKKESCVVGMFLIIWCTYLIYQIKIWFNSNSDGFLTFWDMYMKNELKFWKYQEQNLKMIQILSMKSHF